MWPFFFLVFLYGWPEDEPRPPAHLVRLLEDGPSYTRREYVNFPAGHFHAEPEVQRWLEARNAATRVRERVSA